MIHNDSPPSEESLSVLLPSVEIPKRCRYSIGIVGTETETELPFGPVMLFGGTEGGTSIDKSEEMGRIKEKKRIGRESLRNMIYE